MTTDDAVVGPLERELLTPEFVQTVVQNVLTTAAVPDEELEQRRAGLMAVGSVQHRAGDLREWQRLPLTLEPRAAQPSRVFLWT